MTTTSDMNFCRLTCWGLGLLAGLLIAAVLALLVHYTTLVSLLIGVVSFLVIGYLLARFVCVGGQSATAGALGAAGAAGAVGVAGAASARSEESAAATATTTQDVVTETTARADSGASDLADPVAQAGSDDALSEAGATLSPSARLAGQEELASRKGSWRYEGGDAGSDDGADAAAAAKAKADADAAAADAAAAAAKAKADADAAAAAAKAKSDADAAAAAAKAKADADAAAAAAAAKAKADADAAAAAAAAKAKADADAAAKAKAAADAKKSAASSGAAASGAGSKPAALTGARGGKADDLKKINGVGPKLEGTLNGMGVYHYDQIAGWSDKELEWVDGNLEGFYGRASRDEWIPQAKVLAGQGDGNRDYDGDGIIEGTDEGTKPATLTAARGGKADNLKEIKGIGPKMEKLCNKLGFYHFDQIAGWTRDEVAWVDANLEGFRGRVTRDEWVAQAKILAEGGETEFSKRVEDGGVY